MNAALAETEIKAALGRLPGWEQVEQALEKTFVFADFSAALGFIVRVGLAAESMNHHPHIDNVWNRVTLRLNTHDAGHRITAFDVRLAEAIEGLVRK